MICELNINEKDSILVAKLSDHINPPKEEELTDAFLMVNQLVLIGEPAKLIGKKLDIDRKDIKSLVVDSEIDPDNPPEYINLPLLLNAKEEHITKTFNKSRAEIIGLYLAELAHKFDNYQWDALEEVKITYALKAIDDEIRCREDWEKAIRAFAWSVTRIGINKNPTDLARIHSEPHCQQIAYHHSSGVGCQIKPRNYAFDRSNELADILSALPQAKGDGKQPQDKPYVIIVFDTTIAKPESTLLESVKFPSFADTNTALPIKPSIAGKKGLVVTNIPQHTELELYIFDMIDGIVTIELRVIAIGTEAIDVPLLRIDLEPDGLAFEIERLRTKIRAQQINDHGLLN